MLFELRRAWQAGSQDNIGIVAAGIAHYALLALIPALGAVVLAYGVFATPEAVASHIELLAGKLPASAADLIAGQLEAISGASSGAQGVGLLVSLTIALFGARNGARSLMTRLNIVFEADEQRSFVKGNLVAVAITVAGLAGLIAAGITSAALANLGGWQEGLPACCYPVSARRWLRACFTAMHPIRSLRHGRRYGLVRSCSPCSGLSPPPVLHFMQRISAATTRLTARSARYWH